MSWKENYLKQNHRENRMEQVLQILRRNNWNVNQLPRLAGRKIAEELGYSESCIASLFSVIRYAQDKTFHLILCPPKEPKTPMLKYAIENRLVYLNPMAERKAFATLIKLIEKYQGWKVLLLHSMSPITYSGNPESPRQEMLDAATVELIRTFLEIVGNCLSRTHYPESFDGDPEKRAKTKADQFEDLNLPVELIDLKDDIVLACKVITEASKYEKLLVIIKLDGEYHKPALKAIKELTSNVVVLEMIYCLSKGELLEYGTLHGDGKLNWLEMDTRKEVETCKGELSGR